ncbi:hypothetical protein ACTWP5_31605 [Streptomyces sp. 4N509B]|uniref:hypothetical protein n=1 Tax=Streptomyces sp. 4N509B TaxID=3457413 RepID=UPI003FD3D897
MTTPTPLRPLDVIRAAAAVIAVRGAYRPITRDHDDPTRTPTAWEVEAYLHGDDLYDGPDGRERIDIAAAQAADTAAAVCAWCRAGANQPSRYRSRLARLTSAPTVAPRDLSLLASAVAAWHHDRHRGHLDAERATDAARSRHQGRPGDRLTVNVTVVAVIPLPSRHFGYVVQFRHLVKLRDAVGNVYVWSATTDHLPTRGAAIEITGTVKSHLTYRGIAETSLRHCRWTPTDQPHEPDGDEPPSPAPDVKVDVELDDWNAPAIPTIPIPRPRRANDAEGPRPHA